MQGNESFCSICGNPGRVLGCPSYGLECRDKSACRDRVLKQKTAKENEIRRLKERVLELEFEKTF